MVKNAFSYLQDSLLGNFNEVFLPRAGRQSSREIRISLC